MAKNSDSLFLLEVLIDKIVFVKSPCFSDKDLRTCVNIECPAVQPLEICDDDPGVNVARSSGPFVKTFNNGKSCLFSLKEADISAAMSKYPVKVTVYKSLPCGCLPTKIIMGEATIDMTKEFVQTRNKFIEDPTNVSYQALKDSFRIVGSDGVETGEIIMFLRISCFGNLIITKFQGAGGTPNLGVGGNNAVVDRSCVSKRDFQTTDDPCACGAARGGLGRARTCISGGGGGSGNICHSARDPYNSMPCEDPDDPCFCSGPMQPPKQNMMCRNTDQYCLHVPKDCCPTGNKVVFQMPTDSCGMGHKQRAHFNFTSDGVGDVARDEPGQLLPTTAVDYPGVVYDLPKQVIKLRIGKTVEMPGRKSKLEYQFITPVVTYEKIIPVKDTRTAQCTPCCRSPCCSPGPKCSPPSQLCSQELTGEQMNELKAKYFEEDEQCFSEFILAFINGYNNACRDCKMNPTITECLRYITDKIDIQETLRDYSNTTISWTKLRSSFPSLTMTMCSQDSISTLYEEVNFNKPLCLFGNRETEVYMNLFNNFCQYRASGTQATALINKCLQVNSEINSRCNPSTLDMNSNYDSVCTFSTLPSRQPRRRTTENEQYHDVYFFGRKKDSSKSAGMGYKESKVKIHRTGQTSSTVVRGESNSIVNTASSQTKTTRGASTATCTTKAVSIKEDKPKKPCPAAGQTKGDIVATISHIRIGPREPCPVHGREPCQGPKCIIASGEEQAPVKVSTVTNPRRGVFEIVIRKITGAPLAKNELMLEWTPPPSRPPPCGGPCPLPCAFPTPCRPTKCKMIVCRPSKCLPKCCKKPCRIPSKKCCKVSCCGKKCAPCGPPVCRVPCSIPCAIPCCPSPCSSSCKSSPCLRPCPVGRKRPRKARSQPKFKANRKRTSPCLNRAKTCPVVRCRSMPAPCVGCCFIPPCPPRKCCSVAPCKPPKCCKSSCSICCL